MHTVLSKNNVLIRLTDERWMHIIENHDELAGYLPVVLETIAEPDIIAQGSSDELLAVTQCRKKWLVVIYKELDTKDGFIITAFLTSRLTYILKKKLVWEKNS